MSYCDGDVAVLGALLDQASRQARDQLTKHVHHIRFQIRARTMSSLG